MKPLLPVLERIAQMVTIKAHNIWLTNGDEVRQQRALRVDRRSTRRCRS